MLAAGGSHLPQRGRQGEELRACKGSLGLHGRPEDQLQGGVGHDWALGVIDRTGSRGQRSALKSRRRREAAGESMGEEENGQVSHRC